MQLDGIVVPTPSLDQHLGLLEIVEVLAVEQFVPELAVEGLVVDVLLGTARLDVERLHIDPLEPGTHRFGRELCAIVGSNVIGRSMPDKESGQDLQHVVGPQASGDLNGQALQATFIDHRQHAKYPTVMGSGLDEVIGPYMVSPTRPQADARSII